MKEDSATTRRIPALPLLIGCGRPYPWKNVSAAVKLILIVLPSFYRAGTEDCATYNNQATIFSNPNRVRTENGWICYIRGTTATTTNLAQETCTFECSDLACTSGWTQPLPAGDQCNDREDDGPGVLHWVYTEKSLDECKQKCETDSVCAAIAYQTATKDCATYNENASIFSQKETQKAFATYNPEGVRKETGWVCYTKAPNIHYVLTHTGAGSDGQRWQRGPGGPPGNSAPDGEAPYTWGWYEVLQGMRLSSCQEACVCRTWCQGFSFVTGNESSDVDFSDGACQLMSKLGAMTTTIGGVKSYRKIWCNPNKCDGLVCKPGTAIDVRHVGGKTEINYGHNYGEGQYMMGKVESEIHCADQIGRVHAFEVRYAAYQKPGKCHQYGDYQPDATSQHNFSVERAWVQQMDGVCCAASEWECCGTGDKKNTNRRYCPKDDALCSNRECTRKETCAGEAPLISAEIC